MGIALRLFLRQVLPNSSKLHHARRNRHPGPEEAQPELADIVGKKEASRGELMKLLWAYLKAHNLQDPENKQYFTPDKKMAKVFGEDKIKAFSMAKYLGPHLSNIE